jgi:hypothetical protein
MSGSLLLIRSGSPQPCALLITSTGGKAGGLRVGY